MFTLSANQLAIDGAGSHSPPARIPRRLLTLTANDGSYGQASR